MKYQANNKRYSEMTYRTCGDSGVKLPLISLGLWHNFGGKKINTESKKNKRTKKEQKNALRDSKTGDGSQNKKLEDKLNEQIEKNVELSKKVSDADRHSIVAEISDDLADTEKEKFTSMAENVEYDSADKFREKLETIKESYFPKKKIVESASKDAVDTVAANAPIESNTDAMAAYTCLLYTSPSPRDS